MTSSNVLKLACHSAIIAELRVINTEQPWLTCEFIPHESYSSHSDFFINFQQQYSSGDIKDFDQFFSQLDTNGYSLKNQHSQFVRFIILWDDSNSIVRLRGQRVKNT